MKKTFTIEGYGEYHVPEINFDQLDTLVEGFPELMTVVQSDKFDITNPAHLHYALMQALHGTPFKSLLSILICPAERNYWKTSDLQRNKEFIGRVSVSRFITRDEDGNFVPGEIAESFFASNPLFRAVFDIWTSSLNTGEGQATTTGALTDSEPE